MPRGISAVMEDVGRIVLMEFDTPAIKADDGLLRVEAAGICGSDVGNYTGKDKAKNLPRILGHEILGSIDDIGELAAQRWGVQKGDRVIVQSKMRCGHCYHCLTGNPKFCQSDMSYGTRLSINQPPAIWGAYGQYMYLHPGTALLKISKDISTEAAVLDNAVLANGVQWVRRVGGAGIGSAVVIQGCGAQGLACTIAASASGADPIVVTGLSMDEQRLALAREFGAHVTIDTQKEDLVQRVKESTSGRMADLVVDVTGSPEALLKSIQLVRPQGTVVCAGIMGGRITPIDTDALIKKEIRFQAALTNDLEAIRGATKIIESRKYAVEKIVTHAFPLTEVTHAFEVAARHVPGEDPIKVMLLPWK